MEILLDDKKLLPYVTQKVTYEALPEESFENAVARARIVFANNLNQEKDKACKKEFVARVADSHLEYLHGKETAFDMWESLRRVFERQSLATKNRIKRFLESLRADPK